MQLTGFLTPISASAASAQTAPSACTPDENALTDQMVLVVDDNATDRLALSRMLTAWRYVPSCIDRGNLACLAVTRAQAAGHPYTVVLLDASLPDVDYLALAEQLVELGIPRAHIVLMFAPEEVEGPTQCQQHGLAMPAIKPVQPDALRAILHNIYHPQATRQAQRTPADPRPLRVLLAEDTVVNQQLLQRLLEKHGHVVTIAQDGQEAVECWQQGVYDLIIMDIFMPKLDGKQATAAIRAHERTQGGHIPILALTACGDIDREECLAVGMDDFLAKPIRKEALLQAVARTQEEQYIVPESSMLNDYADDVPQHAPFDRVRALQNLEDDEDLWRQVIAVFLAEHPRQLAVLGDALRLGDAEGVRRAAHTIKGAVGNFAADAAWRAAYALEQIGKAGALADAQAASLRLTEEIVRLAHALHSEVSTYSA